MSIVSLLIVVTRLRTPLWIGTVVLYSSGPPHVACTVLYRKDIFHDVFYYRYGGFLKWGYPRLDGL